MVVWEWECGSIYGSMVVYIARYGGWGYESMVIWGHKHCHMTDGQSHSTQYKCRGMWE